MYDANAIAFSLDAILLLPRKFVPEMLTWRPRAGREQTWWLEVSHESMLPRQTRHALRESTPYATPQIMQRCE